MNLVITEIVRRSCPLLLRNVFEDLFAQENSPKASVLEADYSQRWHDSPNFAITINFPGFFNPFLMVHYDSMVPGFASMEDDCREDGEQNLKSWVILN